MTLYDLYLDEGVNGYLVFKTLSKQKVIDMFEYRYRGDLNITKDDLIESSDSLLIKIDDTRSEDYIDLYCQMMLVKYNDHYQKNDPIFNASLYSSITHTLEMKIQAAIVGTSQNNQPFLMKTNVRNQKIVLDIYFENGQSYDYDGKEVFQCDENEYDKYIKKYKIK